MYISIKTKMKERYARIRQENEARAFARDEYIRSKFPKIDELETARVLAGLREVRSSVEGDNVSGPSLDATDLALTEYLKAHKLAGIYRAKIESCPFCHDRGYIDSAVCTECYKKNMLELFQQEGIEDPLLGISFDTYRSDIFSDELFKEVSVSSYASISPAENMREIKSRLDDYISDFQVRKKSAKPHILFQGKAGTGKSYLALCVASSLRDQGQDICLVSATALQKSINELHIQRQRFVPDVDTKNRLEKIEAAVYTSDFLIIDDVGSEVVDERFTSMLMEIIEVRSKRQKPILISSNYILSELQKRYNERIFSRLIGLFDLYYFYGKDLRQNN